MLILGTTQSEFLSGGAGNDTLVGAGGSDTIDGGAGRDTVSFEGRPYDDPAGYLSVDLETGAATYYNLSGSSYVVRDTTQIARVENVTGSAEDDGIIGDSDDNVIAGGSGDDGLDGRGGNDTLLGGEGRDYFVAGPGDDVIDGGAGFDTVDFSSFSTADQSGRVVVDLSVGRAWADGSTDTIISAEYIFGTTGGDWLQGDASYNLISAGLGNDVVFGYGTTGDMLFGDDGDDAIYGSAGNDTISGGDGIDWIEAGDGDDLISEGGFTAGEWSAVFGGAGNDTIAGVGMGAMGMWGGDGNDRFEIWAAGTEYIRGGTGADTTVLLNGFLWMDQGLVQIFDFEVGKDVVQSSITNREHLVVEVQDWGGNTGILFHDGLSGYTGTVMLMGIEASSLDPGDLILQ